MQKQVNSKQPEKIDDWKPKKLRTLKMLISRPELQMDIDKERHPEEQLYQTNGPIEIGPNSYPINL